jgi:hypothetical protein
MLSKDQLMDRYESLRLVSLNDIEGDTMKLRILSMVYFVFTACRTLLSMHGFSLVDESQFKEDIMRDSEIFFNTLKTATNAPFEKQNMRALLFYSMCFYFSDESGRECHLGGVWTIPSEGTCKAAMPIYII